MLPASDRHPLVQGVEYIFHGVGERPLIRRLDRRQLGASQQGLQAGFGLVKPAVLSLQQRQSKRAKRILRQVVDRPAAGRVAKPAFQPGKGVPRFGARLEAEADGRGGRLGGRLLGGLAVEGQQFLPGFRRRLACALFPYSPRIPASAFRKVVVS